MPKGQRNAQGAALGALHWLELATASERYSAPNGANYVELFDNPSDNNAAPRSNGYETVISKYDGMARGAIAALKEAGKRDGVIVGGFDGAPDAEDAVKSDDLAYTVLQLVAVFSREAVIQADHDIKTGSALVADEKQLFDCLLIIPENVDSYTAAFTHSM